MGVSSRSAVGVEMIDSGTDERLLMLESASSADGDVASSGSFCCLVRPDRAAFLEEDDFVFDLRADEPPFLRPFV